MNFIVELSELAVLTGEGVWSYLVGQGTNVGAVSIAPPKPGDGSPGILWRFILCFPCVLAVQANFLVIYTPSYFSQVFSNCEDKFTLGLMEHTAPLETALPPPTKTCGVAIVISSYLFVECLPCFITADSVFFKAFKAPYWDASRWSVTGSENISLGFCQVEFRLYSQSLCWEWPCSGPLQGWHMVHNPSSYPQHVQSEEIQFCGPRVRPSLPGCGWAVGTHSSAVPTQWAASAQPPCLGLSMWNVNNGFLSRKGSMQI